MARLREAWDNEIEAEALARALANQGAEGMKSLLAVLKEASGRYPKLAVGIINAFRGGVNPLERGLLSNLIDDDSLAEEDSAYLISILRPAGGVEPEHGRKLVRALKRAKDPTDRAEILGEIVRYHVSDARHVLAEMSESVGGDAFNYDQKPDEAAQNERVRFALWALEGRHSELEDVVFGSASHPYRRVAALEAVCLSLGQASGDILGRATRDPDPKVRGVALGLMGELKLTGLPNLIEAGLRDSSPWVVQQAAYALRDIASTQEFSADLDRVKRLRAVLLERMRAKMESEDRTDRQILVPVLRTIAKMLQELLETSRDTSR